MIGQAKAGSLGKEARTLPLNSKQLCCCRSLWSKMCRTEELFVDLAPRDPTTEPTKDHQPSPQV